MAIGTRIGPTIRVRIGKRQSEMGRYGVEAGVETGGNNIDGM
jgi:hypothetical protein